MLALLEYPEGPRVSSCCLLTISVRGFEASQAASLKQLGGHAMA